MKFGWIRGKENQALVEPTLPVAPSPSQPSIKYIETPQHGTVPRKLIVWGVIILTFGLAIANYFVQTAKAEKAQEDKAHKTLGSDNPEDVKGSSTQSAQIIAKKVEDQKSTAQRQAVNKSSANASAASGAAANTPVASGPVASGVPVTTQATQNPNSTPGNMAATGYSGTNPNNPALPPPPTPVQGNAYKPTPITTTNATEGSDALRLSNDVLAISTTQTPEEIAQQNQVKAAKSPHTDQFGLVDLKGGIFP